jgi:hypothetical protein
LTENYLALHSSVITIPYVVLSDMESWTAETNTFLVSNYALTAMESDVQNQYKIRVISECDHGFLVWQTCFGDRPHDFFTSNKNSVLIREESPQTGPAHAKNNYVYF